MKAPFSEADLEAYLDEELSPSAMAAIERALRSQPELGRRLAAIIGRRDAGVHSLGEIWRRHRASCPTREQLGSFVLGALNEQDMHYIRFHIETVGCRFCQANLRDLQQRQQESAESVTTRRRKYYQSSAGYLRRK